MQGHPPHPPSFRLGSGFWTLNSGLSQVFFFRCARTLDSGFWTRSLDSALTLPCLSLYSGLASRHDFFLCSGLWNFGICFKNRTLSEDMVWQPDV